MACEGDVLCTCKHVHNAQILLDRFKTGQPALKQASGCKLVCNINTIMHAVTCEYTQLLFHSYSVSGQEVPMDHIYERTTDRT